MNRSTSLAAWRCGGSIWNTSDSNWWTRDWAQKGTGQRQLEDGQAVNHIRTHSRLWAYRHGWHAVMCWSRWPNLHLLILLAFLSHLWRRTVPVIPSANPQISMRRSFIIEGKGHLQNKSLQVIQTFPPIIVQTLIWVWKSHWHWSSLS